MQSRIKRLVHQGDLIELNKVFSDKSIRDNLIEAITTEDLEILKKNEMNPSWEHAGFANLMRPDDGNYKYRMDMDDKYVVRYKRIPAIGSYDSCLEFVNNIRKKAGMAYLKVDLSVGSEYKSDLDLDKMNYNQLMSFILFKQEDKRKLSSDSENFFHKPIDIVSQINSPSVLLTSSKNTIFGSGPKRDPEIKSSESTNPIKKFSPSISPMD